MAALRYEVVYAAPVGRVFEVLTDEAFLSAYAQEVGAVDYQVRVEGAAEQLTTHVAMTVPTAGVPAVLKRLVTPTIALVERRSWEMGKAPSGRRGSLFVDASSRGRDAKVRADLALAPAEHDAGATRFAVDGHANVNVPLLGELAASLVRDLVGSVIRRQSVVMQRWLSGR
jgi:uncharacterized protein YndB with AHSA1/START domain